MQFCFPLGACTARAVSVFSERAVALAQSVNWVVYVIAIHDSLALRAYVARVGIVLISPWNGWLRYGTEHVLCENLCPLQ